MSVYLPDYQALFVHAPRCGGTWVKRVLNAADVRMEPARGAGNHNLTERYDHPGAYRFTFIRHPLAWYESAWMGLHSSWPARADVPPLFEERAFSPFRLLSRNCSAAAFPDFIQAVLEHEPGFWTRMVEWYVGPPGAPKVNAVGRQEALAAHLATILGKVGWQGLLPERGRENAGEGERPAWPEGLKRDLLAAEAAGVRRWYGENATLNFLGGA